MAVDFFTIGIWLNVCFRCFANVVCFLAADDVEGAAFSFPSKIFIGSRSWELSGRMVASSFLSSIMGILSMKSGSPMDAKFSDNDVNGLNSGAFEDKDPDDEGLLNDDPNDEGLLNDDPDNKACSTTTPTTKAWLPRMMTFLKTA